MPPISMIWLHFMDLANQLGYSSLEVVIYKDVTMVLAIICFKGEIVDVMHGSNPVKMRNMVLDLWRNCVLAGQRRGSITMAEAAPGTNVIHIQGVPPPKTRPNRSTRSED